MRLNPSSPRRAFIERIRVEFTCLTAFTVPITAGRRLSLFRGAGAAASGGTSLAAAANINPKRGSSDTSQFTIANGGDLRIATTAALTTTGITFEATPFLEMSLAHLGASGNFRDVIYEFGGGAVQPIQLEAGQLLAIRNPIAMDAAGTFQMMLSVHWHEATILDPA